MCGIIGEYSLNGDDKKFLQQRDLLTHRGPDFSGFVKLQSDRLKFGHCRLSILDLSDKANQPFSIDGYTIIYNGEVYNFKELKLKIGGVFISNSDTEVILRGYIKYGEEIFSILDGMFALAIYDPKKMSIVLARDRLGVKPLYYYQNDHRFTFASEIPALNAAFNINPKAVEAFLWQNYIYTEEEILKDVYSLPAGSYAFFGLSEKKLEIFNFYKRSNIKEKISDLSQAKKELALIMEKSVKDSLVSDVPVGVFLSAGNDSSLIAAITKKITGRVKTFTVGFDNQSFDESVRAEKIAKIIGSEHYTFKLNKEEIINSIPEILDTFGMPFGDSSALLMYFLSKYTKDHVKVCLSGDGADELFGGYPLYYLPPIASLYKLLPFKSIVERLIELAPTSFNKMSFDFKLRQFIRGSKYDYKTAHFFYRSMNNIGILKDKNFRYDQFKYLFEEVKGRDVKDQLMYIDQKTVLEKNYLIKVDRMSMAHGLEVRVPYLNNDVYDFSMRLDSSLKVKNFTTKYLLKKLLEDYLPKELIYTKKEGFSFPVASWLCEELRDFMMETLSYDNVAKTGFLEYSKVCELIDDHVNHKKDYNRELWGLISLVRFLTKNH